MNAKRFIASLALALSLGACAEVAPVTDLASRGAPMTGAVGPASTQALPRSYAVRDVQVVVPEGLTVSEANSFYPIADIVWRGDPMGNRRQQITEIFEQSFARGTQGLNGATPVVVTVTLRRFHSLTERTRYTVGGTHSIKFDLTVSHAETGAVLEGPRRISADLDGLGGQAAVMAEQAGEGQKVRIMRHLASVALRELGPGQAQVVTASAN